MVNEEHKERKHKKKKEKRPRTPSPEPEKLLQARTKTLGLDQNVGKAQVVQGSREAGFYCEDCDVVLKDQVSYLDHINGRQHLKMIGVSMNVEKSTLAQVKERFEEIKRRAKEPKKIFDLDESVAETIKLEKEMKEKKKEEKKRKKMEKLKKMEEENASFIDKDVSAMMGFGGFGGSKH